MRPLTRQTSNILQPRLWSNSSLPGGVLGVLPIFQYTPPCCGLSFFLVCNALSAQPPCEGLGISPPKNTPPWEWRKKHATLQEARFSQAMPSTSMLTSKSAPRMPNYSLRKNTSIRLGTHLSSADLGVDRKPCVRSFI